MSDAVRGERLKMRLRRENAHALFGIHIQNPMRVQQNQVQMLGTKGFQVINRRFDGINKVLALRLKEFKCSRMHLLAPVQGHKRIKHVSLLKMRSNALDVTPVIDTTHGAQ